MNKNWLYVIVGGILEIFWVLCLKKSEGFSNLSFSIMTIILVIVSFYLFALGMENLPTGIAYTVFTGNESISTFKILFSVLLIIGILGLKMTSKEE
ncbi:DMT family transporter [Vagococcus fluvialis]|uniref:DMT family transporter n=1 Tax=Vagococcus fluvialis TaxID=2738 RepID=UPI003D0F6536